MEKDNPQSPRNTEQPRQQDPTAVPATEGLARADQQEGRMEHGELGGNPALQSPSSTTENNKHEKQ